MITATHKGKRYNVEYSIVNVSELEGELRIDAEYYDPFYLRNEKKITRKKWVLLGDKKVSELITDGDHGNPKYCAEGIPYLNAEDIEETGINLNSAKKVCFEYANTQSKKNYINKNEILITIKGTIGKVCVVLEDVRALLSRDVAKIKLSEFAPISPFFLQAYLMSKHAQILLEQTSTGGLQQGFYLYQIKQLKIPIPSDNFQKFMEKLVLKAYEEKQKAEQFYKQAEEILLEELGLKNWKPKTKKIKIGGQEFEEEENISIRMLSDVVKADRMDAEYWEPKYDEIEELIRNYQNGFSTISKEFLHKTTKLKINKDDYYNYVEISSINTSIGDFTPSFLKGQDLPANARLKLEKNDLIVSKVRTYRKGIALIHKIYPNLIGTSAFVVLHEKENKQINIETLFVFLRTDVFSLWSYKFYTGTSYPTLTDEDILNLSIPLIDPKIQQKISQLIQQSFKARENSKKLLEIAKRTVEIYIEKDEEEGLNYARNKLNELNIEIS